MAVVILPAVMKTVVLVLIQSCRWSGSQLCRSMKTGQWAGSRKNLTHSATRTQQLEHGREEKQSGEPHKAARPHGATRSAGLSLPYGGRATRGGALSLPSGDQAIKLGLEYV